MTQNEQKELVASTAIDTLIQQGKIFSGMKIGLGTGSTAYPAVRHLAKRIADGTIKDIKAVVTSFGTQNLCEELDIPVYSMNDKAIGGHLDLAIDGADEVDPSNNVIKGGGAALLDKVQAGFQIGENHLPVLINGQRLAPELIHSGVSRKLLRQRGAEHIVA